MPGAEGGKRARGPQRRSGARKGSLHAALVVVGCVAVVAALAVIPVFVNTAIGYIPLVSAIALMAFCFLYLQMLKRSLSFDDNPKSIACTRGDTLKFPLTVKNRSLLPAPRIEVTFFISDIFGEGGRIDRSRLTLPPRSEKVFNLGVRFDHIGTVEVGIRQIAIYDPIGLFSAVKQNFELNPVSITPQRITVERIELSDHSLKESSKNIKTFINDGMDYSGTRDYRWGDPMKSIHWKLSSKSADSYFTRLYETPTAPGLAIFLDFESELAGNEALMDAYDAVVESALAIESYATEAGYETELLFVDRQGDFERLAGPIEGRYHDLMTRIPRIRKGSGADMLRLLSTETSSMRCQNNLVICTSNLNEEVIDSCASIAGPSRFPYLVGVMGGIYDEDARRTAVQRLNASRVPYSLVRSASDLVGKER